jgi:hypothetical protein
MLISGSNWIFLIHRDPAGGICQNSQVYYQSAASGLIFFQRTPYDLLYQPPTGTSKLPAISEM